MAAIELAARDSTATAYRPETVSWSRSLFGGTYTSDSDWSTTLSTGVLGSR